MCQRSVQSATVAIAYFQTVLVREAAWWTNKTRGAAGDHPSAAGSGLTDQGRSAGVGRVIQAVSLDNKERGTTREAEFGAPTNETIGMEDIDVNSGEDHRSRLDAVNEFLASPRVWFQRLLMEQGVVVILFHVLETVRSYIKSCDDRCSRADVLFKTLQLVSSTFSFLSKGGDCACVPKNYDRTHLQAIIFEHSRVQISVGAPSVLHGGRLTRV